MNTRFLLDNDGSNFFAHTMTDNVEGSIAEAVDTCPAEVTTYLLCPNGCGKFYYPTEVGEVYPPARKLPDLHARGIDPFGLFLRALRRAGKETFITYRMNDVHGADDPDHPGTADFKKQHPDYVVDPEAAARGEATWMSYCLDYARPEVQDYVLATLRELAALYEIDGFQLDWMRFPRHLSGSPEEVWEKRDALTTFTRQVREVLRAKDPDILLSTRVPTNPAGWRFLGMDVAAWTRQGLVDFIVATPFLTTDFHMPIQELRDLLGDHPVPVYADVEFGHGPQIHCLESLRAAAAGLFDAGADGIYVFNFPCWTEYIGARPYDWLSALSTPETAARKPLLFSVSHTRHRVAGVDLPGQLPASLHIGSSLEVHLHLPQPGLPARRALVLVHSGGDLALKVNGQDAQEHHLLRCAELFVEYIPQEDQSPLQRPRSQDCRFFQVAPAALQVGANTLKLFNTSNRDLEIERINLGIW